jgi:hypothetical protein
LDDVVGNDLSLGFKLQKGLGRRPLLSAVVEGSDEGVEEYFGVELGALLSHQVIYNQLVEM